MRIINGKFSFVPQDQPNQEVRSNYAQFRAWSLADRFVMNENLFYLRLPGYQYQ